MVSWSLKRRIAYVAIVLALIGTLIGWFLFFDFYEPGSCFDEKQNGLESGVDCGGECQFLCSAQVAEPVVLFSRVFNVSNNVYSAVAYVENPNFNIGNEAMPYTFKFYDKRNNLIAEKKGKTFITAGQISPIFEGPIDMGEMVPTKTVFELNDNKQWLYVEGAKNSPFVVRNQKLLDADTIPRVEDSIKNTTVNEYRDVEVVTVIFSAQENAIATSRTFIDSINRKEIVPIVFTWPKPLAKELEVCTVPVDVALLIDVSGSMNDDQSNPPQPLTDAKNAAKDFIGRLTPDDRSGLVTFATNSSIIETLSYNHDTTEARVGGIQILPEEESGSTNMGDAITDAVSILKNVSDVEDRSKKVIVLLTDGIANEPEDPGGEPYALQHVAKAKSNGYTVYTIGIGEGVNAPFLRQLATPEVNPDDKYFFKAASSKDLSAIYSNISDSICERGAAIIDIITRLPDVKL